MNAVAAAPNSELLTGLFEEAVRRFADRIAIDVPPGLARPERSTLTYAELNQCSDSLANAVVDILNGPGVTAILLSRQSPWLYISMLAALKAGATYICLDPSFPDAQIVEILRDSGARILLTDRDGFDWGNHPDLPALQALNVTCAPASAALPQPLSPTWLTPHTLAYIIYTSGTTGKPKGVQITHRSITNLIRSDVAEFTPGPGDRIAQGSSAAYDSSVEEIWMALASGATVVAMDEDAVRSGPDLTQWLREERITVFCPPPTLLRAASCEDPAGELPELRLLYVGGEALPTDVVDLWAPGRRLVNGYGPTECTVTALRTDIQPGDPIRIGRPVPGANAFILDADLNLLPNGEPGELCISGIGLAVGYHERPDLTSERFPLHPVFGRIYRTGDLALRSADGEFTYCGRLDSQVKLRGYRIELEAIEACLAEQPGVREAACRVQDTASRQEIAAHIVPANSASPPDFGSLKAAIRTALPAYMEPAVFGLLKELPKSIGGKIKRDALPILKLHGADSKRPIIAPSTEIEALLCALICEVLDSDRAISTDDDFFHDLGGSSLTAARLISKLRKSAATSGLTVRDIYESRTVSGLAQRAGGHSAPVQRAHPENNARVSSVRATATQTLVLLLRAAGLSYLAYISAWFALPAIISSVGPKAMLLSLPIVLPLILVAYTAAAVAGAIVAKRLFIGTYRPQKAPVWGDFYIRNWLVQRAVHLVPWQIIAGTEFQCMALRALGANIGKRVHIHRGVDLTEGGWDLLQIGDDVTLQQDVALHLVQLEDRQLVLGNIIIGDGATLQTRAAMGPHTSIGRNAVLSALSYLPEGGSIPDGALWDGIAAQPAGDAANPPAISYSQDLAPMIAAIAMLTANLAVALLTGLPYVAAAAIWVFRHGVNSAAIHYLLLYGGSSTDLVSLIAAAILPFPAALALEAAVARALGKVPEGVISRWSIAYIRVWIKAGLVDSAGHWLSGALFWPLWLRLAGMKIGKGCEISTIIDVLPELVEIGEDTFFADGIYLGGPDIQRGAVSLRKTTLSPNTFLGNHSVIRSGDHLPGDLLLGVCTVSDASRMKQGTSWFGHPPFELPVREIVECDRSLTHNPGVVRYTNRLIWELSRFAIPVPAALLAVAWFHAVGAVFLQGNIVGAAVELPCIALVFEILPCMLILALKWLLLGRVRPGTHPLWSCWCSRWDFLYVAWGFYGRALLTSLEGTEMLTAYLRAVGMKIGKGVVLGHGSAQVVDPDMLEFGDYSTISAMFQAHTFEDRVLKIDTVVVGKYATLGAATVPLYGAVIGDNTLVTPHGVVMKQELLLPNIIYEGAPTRAQVAPHPIAQTRAPQPHEIEPDIARQMR